MNNKDLFAKNRTLLAKLALENFTANEGETKDFRINYAFSHSYYDLTPESTANPFLQFNVVSTFNEKNLGLGSQQGKVFSYRVTLKNTKPHFPPVIVPMNGTTRNSTNKTAATMPIIFNGGGLGMVISIVRIPSCL